MEKIILNFKTDIENTSNTLYNNPNFGGMTDKIADRIAAIIAENLGDVYEVAWNVSELENNNGSWYCSSPLAKQDFATAWDVFAILSEDYRAQIGDEIPNVLTDPEGAHLLLMLHACTILTKQVLEFWQLDEIIENYEILECYVDGLDLIVEYNEQ